FAAPPVLMVARVWQWTTPYMIARFGWRSLIAIALSNAAYWLIFRSEMHGLASRVSPPDNEQPDEDTAGRGLPLSRVPAWITCVHLLFVAWTVINAHYPVIFV